MHRLLKALGPALALASSLALAQGAGKDLLDRPAMPSALAARMPLNGIARAGNRLVAVGQRGHILVAADGALQWTQATVPVRVDLTAVHFPSANKGWAVGHDGVVLHSSDGGQSWTKQLDGNQAARLIIDHYQGSPAAAGAEGAAILAEAKRMAAEGADQPFLGVWFENEETGYVVGAFNLIFMTIDGGRSWRPISDRTDNPKAYHLYDIRGLDGEPYIAGELGLLLRFDRSSSRFVAVSTPYQGTYFGILPTRNAVIAYGLRGNAFRSADGGKTWQKTETGIQTGLTGGAVLSDGVIVLASQGGQVLVSRDQGRSFKRASSIAPLPFHGVAGAAAGKVALVGARGVRVETIPAD